MPETRYRIYEQRLDESRRGHYLPQNYATSSEAISVAVTYTERYGAFCQYRVEGWYGDGYSPHRIVVVWNSIGQQEWAPQQK